MSESAPCLLHLLADIVCPELAFNYMIFDHNLKPSGSISFQNG